jgi:hypothetical protein
MTSPSATPLFLPSPPLLPASPPPYLNLYPPGVPSPPSDWSSNDGGWWLPPTNILSSDHGAWDQASQVSDFHSDSVTVVTVDGTPPPPSPARSGSVISWAPSRQQSRASSRASSAGPVRRRRGSIVPGQDNIDDLEEVNTRAHNFRFSGKTYFCTWSQVGDVPNSALEDKLSSFGNQIKGTLALILMFVLALM